MIPGFRFCGVVHGRPGMSTKGFLSILHVLASRNRPAAPIHPSSPTPPLFPFLQRYWIGFYVNYMEKGTYSYLRGRKGSYLKLCNINNQMPRHRAMLPTFKSVVTSAATAASVATHVAAVVTVAAWADGTHGYAPGLYWCTATTWFFCMGDRLLAFPPRL